jgi:hypothetical protein
MLELPTADLIAQPEQNSARVLEFHQLDCRYESLGARSPRPECTSRYQGKRGFYVA